jgi:hypothetical protein
MGGFFILAGWTTNQNVQLFPRLIHLAASRIDMAADFPEITQASPTEARSTKAR